MYPSRFELQHRAFLAEVQLRYATQFGRADGGRPEVEFMVGPGWYGLLRELFAEVAGRLSPAESAVFRWRSIRELGGRLCLSHEGATSEIAALAKTAAARAEAVCRVCSACGRPRQVDGVYAVDCDLHFAERVLRHALADESAVQGWLTTPRRELGDICPRDALAVGRHVEVVLSQALHRALPPVPRITGCRQDRLEALWHSARAHLGQRLRALRMAERAGSQPGAATLLVIVDVPHRCADTRGLVDALNAVGLGALRPQLVSTVDLEAPLAAADPWPAMLARYASVELSGR